MASDRALLSQEAGCRARRLGALWCQSKFAVNGPQHGIHVLTSNLLRSFNLLSSEEAQDIIGKNLYRPISEKAKTKYASAFPKLTLFTIDDAFGGWTKVAKEYLADGGTFDQIYTSK